MTLFGSPDEIDGMGQSWLTEIRQYWRFVKCRRKAVVWQSNIEAIEHDTQLMRELLRFGDETVASACVAGRHWIVRQRDFYGWPDPPRFVFFAIEGDRIWAAADFHDWPAKWERSSPEE